jgi:hypothetical protein
MNKKQALDIAQGLNTQGRKPQQPEPAYKDEIRKRLTAFYSEMESSPKQATRRRHSRKTAEK